MPIKKLIPEPAKTSTKLQAKPEIVFCLRDIKGFWIKQKNDVWKALIPEIFLLESHGEG